MSERRQPARQEGWSYSGEVWTDANGRAVVTLPAVVGLHREGFEYELTPLGTQCEASVVEAIAARRFTIATSRPHVKVAWRLTPLREQQDESAAESAGPTRHTSRSPNQPAEGSNPEGERG